MNNKYEKIVGVPFPAPTWAKWMAFDSNGKLWFYSLEPVLGNISWWLGSGNPFHDQYMCLDLPITCSNPDWWKGTKREIDASSGVVYIYIKAPVWARWMAFDSDGDLYFYDKKPLLTDGFGRWVPTSYRIRSDIRLLVPRDAKDKNWWKGSLRKLE